MNTTHKPNQVAGSDWLPGPTPPCVRLRPRRFRSDPRVPTLGKKRDRRFSCPALLVPLTNDCSARIAQSRSDSGNCTLHHRTASAFTSTGIPDVFGVLCPLDAPCRPSMRFFSISSRFSPSLPSPGRSPFPSWLQMVVSSFSCSGIPTRDLNPIYNVPMLGTHKPRHAPLTSPSVSMISRNFQPQPRVRRWLPLVGLPSLRRCARN